MDTMTLESSSSNDFFNESSDPFTECNDILMKNIEFCLIKDKYLNDTPQELQNYVMIFSEPNTNLLELINEGEGEEEEVTLEEEREVEDELTIDYEIAMEDELLNEEVLRFEHEMAMEYEVTMDKEQKEHSIDQEIKSFFGYFVKLYLLIVRLFK